MALSSMRADFLISRRAWAGELGLTGIQSRRSPRVHTVAQPRSREPTVPSGLKRYLPTQGEAHNRRHQTDAGAPRISNDAFPLAITGLRTTVRSPE
jgi:hypothetical protein